MLPLVRGFNLTSASQQKFLSPPERNALHKSALAFYSPSEAVNALPSLSSVEARPSIGVSPKSDCMLGAANAAGSDAAAGDGSAAGS
jgi:hypothetical protein